MHSAPYRLTERAGFVLSNRLAYEYDLTEPRVNIQIARSATVEVLYQALLAIRVGSCLSAFVGGATLS